MTRYREVAFKGVEVSDQQAQNAGLDLWQAIVASPVRTAQRERSGNVWYVARANAPSAGPVLQVVCQTTEGWQGWQVGTIVEVGVLLAHLWQVAPGNGAAIWPGWAAEDQPLAEIVGKIIYQSIGLADASAAREGQWDREDE